MYYRPFSDLYMNIVAILLELLVFLSFCSAAAIGYYDKTKNYGNFETRKMWGDRMIYASIGMGYLSSVYIIILIYRLMKALCQFLKDPTKY